MRNNGKAKCRICNKKIKIDLKSIGVKRHRYTSEEGVLFTTAWFCNSCWNKILKYTKNQILIKKGDERNGNKN